MSLDRCSPIVAVVGSVVDVAAAVGVVVDVVGSKITVHAVAKFRQNRLKIATV